MVRLGSMKRHRSEPIETHTHAHIHTHTPIGFEAYVTQEMIKQAKEEIKERDKIQITPTDTKESIQMKRNRGVCEYFGCRISTGLEWHNDYVTWSVWGEEKPVRRQEGVYRNISNYRPTNNPFVIEAYEQELMLCTLLCKKHHTHTHTHHRVKILRIHQHRAPEFTGPLNGEEGLL